MMSFLGSRSERWVVLGYAVMIALGLGVLALGALGLFGLFPAGGERSGMLTLVALGVLGVIVPASLLPIALATKRREASAAVTDAAIRETPTLLRSINDRMLLSDAAKQIAYRESDREALRTAIREDIEKEDYDAAMVLVEQMRESYGYRQEAEQFREEIEQAREASREEKITQAIREIDEMLESQEWEKAAAAAAKVKRLYHESPRVAELPRRVEQARERHKHQLERDFLEAAKREDVESAMRLLKELDKYLTEEEAAPYMETARGVISKQQQNIAVRFKLAIHDKDWRTAVEAGEQIIQEFPNSQMAGEVRKMLDVLRQRASQQTAESGTYEALDETETASSAPRRSSSSGFKSG